MPNQAKTKTSSTKTPSTKTPSTKKPNYWEQACDELMKQDRIMRKLIPKYGDGILGSRGDAFTTLARSIVGQQISVAAAQSVWNRTLETLQHEVTPARVLKTKQEDLRASGLSNRKVEYIRGIGRWTAEMFLIFNLMRPNVLPLDDIGLIRAISINYFSGEPVSRHEAREVAANWAPWRTVATWYMWRSIDPIPVEY